MTDELNQLDKLLVEHEDALRSCYGGDRAKRARHVIESYRRTATDALRTQKQFRDDCLVFMRSLEMVVGATLQAGTHGEKNARLRGVSELIGYICGKLRAQEFEFGYRHSDFPYLFDGDAPTRDFLSRIRELEHQVKSLQSQWSGDCGELIRYALNLAKRVTETEPESETHKTICLALQKLDEPPF